MADPILQFEQAVRGACLTATRSPADRALRSLQQLRSDDADRVMVAITGFGSVGVLLPLLVAVLGWLLWRRCWRTAGYWVGTAAFAELLVQVLKLTIGRHRPALPYAGTERYSFPSGHATVSVVVLGMLAFLLARGQPRAWRITVAATVAPHHVVQAAPQTVWSKPVVQVVHRDTIHIGAEHVIVVPADTETYRTEVE